MGAKTNFSIIIKNRVADRERGFLTKSISKPYGRATAIPPAWKLNIMFKKCLMLNQIINKFILIE